VIATPLKTGLDDLYENAITCYFCLFVTREVGQYRVWHYWVP